MSATEKHITEQCKRLAAVPVLMPTTTDGKREIREALLRHCQSNEHATATVTAFLENSIECRNIVAELVQIARASRRADDPPPGCDRCWLGPDPYTGEARWAAHVQVNRNGFECAVRCTCERGKWLAAESSKPHGKAERGQPKMQQPSAADFGRRAAGDRD